MGDQGGGGDDFDQSLCECYFSHEFAMRRLLNLVSECIKYEEQFYQPMNTEHEKLFILFVAVIIH